MNEDAFAKQLTKVLDRDLDTLRPEIVHKLERARARACARAQQNSGIQTVHSAHGLTLIGWVRQHRTGALVILLTTLLAVAAGIWQTPSSNPGDDTADIDAGLLTGDLPVNAYLDNHLNKWVNNNSN